MIVVFFKLIHNVLFKFLRTDEHGAFVPGRRGGVQGKKAIIFSNKILLKDELQATMAKEKTYSTKERKEMVTIQLFERDKSIVLTSLSQDHQETEVR